MYYVATVDKNGKVERAVFPEANQAEEYYSLCRLDVAVVFEQYGRVSGPMLGNSYKG